MNGTCIGEPISWLKLELYELGELKDRDLQAVEEHLEHCDACSSRLALIRSDKRSLPPLPETDRTVVLPALRRMRGFRRAVMTLPFLAAAAMALVTLLPAKPHKSNPFSGKVRWKGGELALMLVREHLGAVQESPRRFSPGDRFMIRLTCPPDASVIWDVAVFQGGEVYFPYQPSAAIGCGNLVPLPGGFTLDGDRDAMVCVFTDTEGIDRQTILQLGLAGVRKDAYEYGVVCTRLRARRGKRGAR